jgi:GT2 family glycosyltransferase
MSSSIVPQKILIVIPEERVLSLPNLDYKSVEVLATKFRGQVQQRIAGFSKSQTDFVMQLDDDIELAYDCIEILIGGMQICIGKVALAPALRYKKDKTSAFLRKKPNLYYWIMNGSRGYQAGSVYLSGNPEGVDFDEECNLIESQWLYGGCVLHRKSDLVLENFFPFKGKAYCEDLIHSAALRKKGIKLFFMPKANAYFEMDSYTTYDVRAFTDFLRSDCRARKYYNDYVGVKSKRIYFFYLIMILNYLKSNIFRL